MTMSNLLALPAILLALSAPLLAQQLPYNPSRLLRTAPDSSVLVFSPNSDSQFSFIDIRAPINASITPSVVTASLPFLEGGSKSFIPVTDAGGVTVFAGDCSKGKDGLELWRFNIGGGDNNGSWTKIQTSSADSSPSSNYLAAGFSFSPTDSATDASVFVFGGMCPNGPTDAKTWTKEATYSNTMVTVSPNQDAQYQLSITGERAPPIAEAGLSITALTPTTSNSSTGNVSQQQNFVLLGGHTETAFINMSQVALFSLPEQSWAFLGVNQPGASGGGELVRKDNHIVEPRSGHTAVMTADGTKIIVFGGWVGDVSNPASPQLAVLEIGQGYGGSGPWAWKIPQQTANPFSSGNGIYGHGAIMLPGDVMMVSGGRAISNPGAKIKRDLPELMFYNVTSSAWISSYTDTSLNNGSSSSSGLRSSQKAGLGAGIGLGLAAAGAITVAWLLYARRLRKQRTIRERELRALALGGERSFSASHLGSPGIDGRGGYPEMRSASWGSQQERHIENDNPTPGRGYASLDETVATYGAVNRNGDRRAERTGLYLDVPSPTRGLRRNPHFRGPMPYGSQFKSGPSGPGAVFTITEEEEERSRQGSLKRTKSPQGPRPLSDPFKDPPNLEPPNEAAEQRKREIKGWAEDWVSAAESLSMSRSPSKANSRTYSNLSAYHSSSSGTDGRSSPNKSDRTGSNLSENSHYSDISIPQSMIGSISRTISQRSVSAGYALFAGAAAAMGKFSARPEGLDRSASKRSVSHGDLAGLAGRRRSGSFSRPTENSALLYRTNSKEREYWTPPESPIKDYKNRSRTSSLTSQGKKALSKLGGVKRVLTGTGTVDVQGKVTVIEGRSGSSSPTKHSETPQMSEITPRGTTSTNAAFLVHKKGAKGWEDSANGSGASPVDTKRRSGVSTFQGDDYDGEDWDVETAIQQRLVQVMFTVPKEKLRVVNADAMSLISRSDTNASDPEQRDAEINRMSSVREEREAEQVDEELIHVPQWEHKGKGKAI